MWAEGPERGVRHEKDTAFPQENLHPGLAMIRLHATAG